MKKYYNDKGKVGVLFSPGYGAGWSSWSINEELTEELLFDPEVIEMVLSGKEVTEEYCKSRWGENFYAGGASGLEVKFLDPGTQFKIDEYDGFETVVTNSDVKWVMT